MQLMSSDFLIASGIMYVTMAGKKIFESLAKPNKSDTGLDPAQA